MTNPPLVITEDELAEGFEVLDKALEIADQAMDS
jgi:4-aminobutyrate aminotransferase-like enzyme